MFSVDIRRGFLLKPDATLEEAMNLAYYEAIGGPRHALF